eukprot:3438246-Prymnesium_polylepis.3
MEMPPKSPAKSSLDGQERTQREDVRSKPSVGTVFERLVPTWLRVICARAVQGSCPRCRLIACRTTVNAGSPKRQSDELAVPSSVVNGQPSSRGPHCPNQAPPRLQQFRSAPAWLVCLTPQLAHTALHARTPSAGVRRPPSLQEPLHVPPASQHEDSGIGSIPCVLRPEISAAVRGQTAHVSSAVRASAVPVPLPLEKVELPAGFDDTLEPTSLVRSCSPLHTRKPSPYVNGCPFARGPQRPAQEPPGQQQFKSSAPLFLRCFPTPH